MDPLSWQVVVVAAIVLVPLALLGDFWPRRERFGPSGRPLTRDWRPPSVGQDTDRLP